MLLIKDENILTKYFLYFKTLLGKFARLSWKRKLMVFESFCLMGIVRFAILIFPFRRIASLMGTQMAETPSQSDKDIYRKALEIGWIIQKTSVFTPWESKCLVQALTAQYMLKRCSISSTLYLGITKEGTSKLLAHAWLRCGELIVTGNKERSMFKTVAYFACHVGNNKSA